MKQNITLCLLSVIATLLVVLTIQSFQREPVLHGQLGGGTSTVGPIGVATGKISGGGDAAAFWLYLPEDKRLLCYVLGRQNRLELRAARNVEFDTKLNDYGMKGRAATVAEVKKEVERGGTN